MTPAIANLTAEEQSTIDAALKDAEAARYTRQKFLTLVSDELDKLRLDDARRLVVFDFARSRAQTSILLLSDKLDSASFEAAREMLRESARRLTASAWRPIVYNDWPSPISHEIERLLQEMMGAQENGAQYVGPSPDAVLLQMKDAFEILIKLTTVILMCALISSGPTNGDWARNLLFRRGLSLGHWVAMLRDATSRSESEPSFPLPKLPNAIKASKLIVAASEFVAIRNNAVGHGARTLNPIESAALVIGAIETGTVRNLRGDQIPITPLARVLGDMVVFGAFDSITLVASRPGESWKLTGFPAAHDWLHDQRHATHDGTVIPASMRLSGETSIPLSPFVAARICNQCARRDLLLFDSLHQSERGGRFDLLDYARGHKSRAFGAEVTDLADAFRLTKPEDAVELAGSSTNFGRVLEALDKSRIDQNYLSPQYLRDDIALFLKSHDRGVYWLQAPAHVGKTTFAQGLAEAELGEPPIDSRFSRENGGRIVAYYCRKEYRTGVAGMLNTLQDRLIAAFDPSQNIRSEQPQVQLTIRESTAQAFLRWLSDWRDFAAKFGLAPRAAPLLVVIDGLDEADPPAVSSPIHILPKPSEVPAGIYLLLTSRLVSDRDAPQFLETHVARLYVT